MRRGDSAHWTTAEDRVMAREWADCRRRALLEKLPRRSWRSICSRARRLGLPRKDQGAAAVGTLAVRLGASSRQLRRILDTAGVRVFTVQPSRGHRSTARHYWWRVDPEAAEHAYLAWLDLETLAGAAARRELCSKTLWMWALRSGAVVRCGRGRPLRLPSAMVDRIIETRGREPLTFDLATYLRVEVARRIAESDREAIRAAQRAEVVRWVRPQEEARRAS